MAELTPDAIAQARPQLVDGVDHEPLSDGSLRLHGPLLQRGPLMRVLCRWFRRPPRICVELDDIGSWVAERLDGRPLQQLANDLAAHLKLERREAEAALVLFIRMLLKRRLIRLNLGKET